MYGVLDGILGKNFSPKFWLSLFELVFCIGEHLQTLPFVFTHLLIIDIVVSTNENLESFPIGVAAAFKREMQHNFIMYNIKVYFKMEKDVASVALRRVV